MLLPESLPFDQPESRCCGATLCDTDRSWHTLNYLEPLKIKKPAWTIINI